MLCTCDCIVIVGAFFWHWLSNMLVLLVGQGIGLVIGAWIDNMKTALAVGIITILYVMLVGEYGSKAVMLCVWLSDREDMHDGSGCWYHARGANVLVSGFVIISCIGTVTYKCADAGCHDHFPGLCSLCGPLLNNVHQAAPLHSFRLCHSSQHHAHTTVEHVWA